MFLEIIISYRAVFFGGVYTTLTLTALSCLFGTILGLLLLATRSAKIRIIRYVAIGYIELMLALPVLALLIWIYFALPMATEHYVSFTAYWSAVAGLALSTAPFVAEIVRGGIESVSPRQAESALVLGLTPAQVYRYIVFPQALRRSLPPLFSNYVAVAKLSALASVIAVPELLYTAQNLSVNLNRPLEIYTAMGFYYLVLLLPLSALTRYLERRWKVRA